MRPAVLETLIISFLRLSLFKETEGVGLSLKAVLFGLYLKSIFQFFKSHDYLKASLFLEGSSNCLTACLIGSSLY